MEKKTTIGLFELSGRRCDAKNDFLPGENPLGRRATNRKKRRTTEMGFFLSEKIRNVPARATTNLEKTLYVVRDEGRGGRRGYKNARVTAAHLGRSIDPRQHFPNDRCDVSTRRFLFSRIKRAGFVCRPWINREFSFFFLFFFLLFLSFFLSYIVLYRDSRDRSTLRKVCYVSTRYLRGDLEGVFQRGNFDWWFGSIGERLSVVWLVYLVRRNE